MVKLLFKSSHYYCLQICFETSFNKCLDFLLSEPKGWKKRLGKRQRQVQRVVPTKVTMARVLRHGGASEDVLSARRTLAEVKTRGHWAQDSSVKRYAKPGMVQQLLAAMSPAARAHGEAQWTRLEDLFNGRARSSWPVT